MIKAGSLVRIRPGAKTSTGRKPMAFIYNGIYRVDAISDNYALLDKEGIHSQYNLNDLIEHSGN